MVPQKEISPRGGDKMYMRFYNWVNVHSYMIVDLIAKMVAIL